MCQIFRLCLGDSYLMSEKEVTCKVYLYNCSNTYVTLFNRVCILKTKCFYFCLCFYEKFIKGIIYKKGVTYEHDGKVCCCCLKCLKAIRKRIYFSEKKEDYFNELNGLSFFKIY